MWCVIDIHDAKTSSDVVHSFWDGASWSFGFSSPPLPANHDEIMIACDFLGEVFAFDWSGIQNPKRIAILTIIEYVP